MSARRPFRIGLGSQLAAAFALVAGLPLLGLALTANLVLESQAAGHAAERLRADRAQVERQLADSWTETEEWNHFTLSVIGMQALERGLVMSVYDADGVLVWDARSHNEGRCRAVLEGIALAMAERYPGWTGRWEEIGRPVEAGGRVVGTARFGWYGPFSFTESELYFLATFNVVLLGGAGFALAAAGLLGWLMARRIGGPILRMTAAATALRGGDLAVRATGGSRVRELADLAAALNGLAAGLGRQEELRRRLTADVAHELRTPLAVLQGRLEAMADGVQPASADNLEDCRNEVVRLGRLVGRIEGLARVEAGEAPPDLRPVALAEAAERAARGFEAAFAERGIAFAWSSGPGTVWADPDHLAQILVNLLSNALKYTPPGGWVRLEASAETDGGWGRFTVADSGPGLDAEARERVFERFWRADPSRARDSGGAGLGLTIARSLARGMDGDIGVESEPGKGAAFSLWLPARPAIRGTPARS